MTVTSQFINENFFQCHRQDIENSGVFPGNDFPKTSFCFFLQSKALQNRAFSRCVIFRREQRRSARFSSSKEICTLCICPVILSRSVSSFIPWSARSPTVSHIFSSSRRLWEDMRTLICLSATSSKNDIAYDSANDGIKTVHRLI